MAGKVVNIRTDVEDSFYRYKMPLLMTKIEGRGNGIKTVITNMGDVARALSRPPLYPTKYFGCELGAQSTFNDDTERYIVNGAHDASRVRELLDGFIAKFVLCASCKNPETELVVHAKQGDVIRDCKACGTQSAVPPQHRLTTFILKNPPKTKKASGKAGKKATAGADSIPGQPGDENGDDDQDGGGDTDDELTRKIEAGAASVLSDEQARKLIAERENDDDWAVDTSKEAVAARVNALGGRMQGSLMLGDSGANGGGGLDDDDGAIGGPYDDFGDWVKEHRETATDAEIYLKADEMGIAKKHKTCLVLVQALFTADGIAQEIPKHAALLQKLVTSEKHQKSLLGGVERFVGVSHPELVKTLTPKILMALYQEDVLEEDLVKQWGTHVSKKYVDKDTSKSVRKAAQPFLTWLEEADDDDDDDE